MDATRGSDIDADAIDRTLEAVADARLTYATDDQPGYRRRRRGAGFSYEGPAGGTVDPAVREWIESLAIPPAWTDVWICTRRNGHLLATGRDARGRKQYRYHPRWRQVRDEGKFDRLLDFAGTLADLRASVDEDLRRRIMDREHVLAIVVRLLDQTCPRRQRRVCGRERLLRPDHPAGRSRGHQRTPGGLLRSPARAGRRTKSPSGTRAWPGPCVAVTSSGARSSSRSRAPTARSSTSPRPT